MNLNSRYLHFFREYKSVILRFVLLISSLLLINFSQAQLGDDCGIPIKILDLPFTHSGDILTYGNDYDHTDVPYVINNPYSTTPFDPNYLKGSEVVYRYTSDADGFVDVSFTTNQLNSSIWVLVDCPFSAAIGWDYSTTEYGGEILDLPIVQGQDYYFVLSSSNQSANYSFDFEIKSALPGKQCENPIEINSLPHVHTGLLGNYGNNYNSSDMPPAAPDAIHDDPYDSSFLNGYDVVYSYTASSDSYLTAGVYTGVNSTIVNVFTGCPFQSTLGWSSVVAGQFSNISNIPVSSGQTYYFVISTQSLLGNYAYSFSLEEVEGLICESPIQISDFPFTAEGEIISSNNYDDNDAPPAYPSAVHDVPYDNSYLKGPEAVFAYTATANEYVDASVVTSQVNSSLWVITGCPFETAMGWDYASSSGGTEIKEIQVTAGITYYFILSGKSPNATYSYTFNLRKSHGRICDSAIKITDLPFSHEDFLSAYENDYSVEDIPAAIANPIAASSLEFSRINENEVVYMYIPNSNQFVSASVIGGGFYKGLWVFTGCPFETLQGWDMIPTENRLEINDIPLLAGVTYYFVVSYTYSSVFEFVFELEESIPYDCPDLQKNIGDPCNDSSSSTHGDYVRQDCSCEGSGLGAFINLTIPSEASCGQRDVVVRAYIPTYNIPVIDFTYTVTNSATFTIYNMPIGTVDLYIEVDGALRKVIENYTLNSGSNNIELTELVLGDLSGDNTVNVTDFSQIVSMFGASPSDSNYDTLADLNCDSTINVVDFSLLVVNFGLQGVSLP